MTHERTEGVTTRNTTLLELRALTPLTAPESMDSFSLPLATWEAWAPGRSTQQEWRASPPEAFDPAGAAADIGFVDPMLRRRLGPVARAALNVAHRCLGERTGVPMVFASRHGELARTLTMLNDLAAGEEVSPASFSLSVHNASAGVFSIARQDTAPATAIAAGDETLGMALIEAAARLSAEQPQILLVYADAPVPELYTQDIDSAETPHALALLLDIHGPSRLHMATQRTSAAPTDRMMGLSLLHVLAGHGPSDIWTGQRSTWQWTLADA
ncbi:MAG: beta-ketoacyl synthase chain length factor [Denitromonas halophila]|nr:MAG: beta-ketoacyl synthase chain length factor [Denitromonas halophila]TVT73286.1 MAG: beta-ketoacyl synthase chain length factor [Denitromonas halophila]